MMKHEMLRRIKQSNKERKRIGREGERNITAVAVV
jgi:hypothetical protein